MKSFKICGVLSLVVLTVSGCSGPGSVPPQVETPAAETRTDGGDDSREGAIHTPPAPSVQEPPGIPPVPPPSTEPVIVTVPAGTVLNVAFLDSVSSQESQPGDSFRTRVTQDVMQEGLAVIPAGSVVVGTVTEAQALNKKIGGKAKLALEFSMLELTSGRSAAIRATFDEVGKSETKKDAATIGGAAAGGALLGRLIKKKKKDKGALIGAIVGAAAGTAIAAKTEGEEILIATGTEISLLLSEPAHIAIRP